MNLMSERFLFDERTLMNIRNIQYSCILINIPYYNHYTLVQEGIMM